MKSVDLYWLESSNSVSGPTFLILLLMGRERLRSWNTLLGESSLGSLGAWEDFFFGPANIICNKS